MRLEDKVELFSNDEHAMQHLLDLKEKELNDLKRFIKYFFDGAVTETTFHTYMKVNFPGDFE